PFPGLQIMSHPRLAYDPANGALLAAAIASDQVIYLNRMIGTTWQRYVRASHPTTRIDINVGAQTIRTAYGFSFDVGAPSVTERDDRQIIGDDSIRVLYTTRDAETKRIYVRGSACSADLGRCND